MDPSDAIQLVILFILLLLSAFFSSAETAMTSVNKLRMRSLADDNVKGAQTVIKLIENPPKLLSTVLIGNNIVNLTASSLATSFALRFGNIGVGIATGLLTVIILIFGEITPKSVATLYAENICLAYGNILYFMTKIMTPVIYIINKLSNGFLKLLRIDPNAKTAVITENELRTIVDVSHQEGVIESEERRMITNVVDFGDSLAKDVMVPRIDMEFANVDLTYDELCEAFFKDKYTRMPIYSETRDNIVGIVNLKDLFFYQGKQSEFKIESVLREPYFTYEYKKTSELFMEMRRQSISIAIVLDEYGSPAGLITLEDLLEEIVGEIRDEYDGDEEDSITCIGPDEYIACGNTKLDEINEVIGLNLDSDDYDSIAGHIICLLDHLPEPGETITDENVVFTVKEVEKNRIDKVYIHLLNNPQFVDE